MSPVAIVGTGYTDAASHLNDANQLALMTYRDLATGLADSGAMAGSDTTAADFAAAYDDAAQATVDAHADLVDALASLGMAVRASLGNHARAEHAANPFGPITDDNPTWQHGTWYDAAPTVVPSSLGGDSSSLPGWASWILDHVGGFVWPDADTDALGVTASTWRDAASDLRRQTSTQAAACGALARERSPEILVACAEILQVEQATTQLATQMDDLATTCESYATQVETQREVILDIVRDLVRDAVLMQIAGGLLDLVTGPGGTAAATAGVVARIGSRAPELLRALDAIRDAARGFAVTLKIAGQGAKDLTVDFRRYANLRLASRFAVDTRKLDGTFHIGGEFAPGFLRRADGIRGTHVVSTHVARSTADLMKRFASRPTLKWSSTFADEEAAELAVRSAMQANRSRIAAWLNGKQPTEAFVAPALGRVGRILNAAGQEFTPKTVRLVLKRDLRSPTGYRILTAYPTL